MFHIDAAQALSKIPVDVEKMKCGINLVVSAQGSAAFGMYDK